MVKTRINRIEIQHNNTLIVFFNYLGIERFTYLTPISVKYWETKNKLNIMTSKYINVIFDNSIKRYKIINISNTEL